MKGGREGCGWATGAPTEELSEAVAVGAGERARAHGPRSRGGGCESSFLNGCLILGFIGAAVMEFSTPSFEHTSSFIHP